MSSSARNRTRVVLHVDLDAFYCKSAHLEADSYRARSAYDRCLVTGQVEMKRVGIPAHVPCAVQQWEGLIAGKAGANPQLLLRCCVSNVEAGTMQ